MDKVKAGGDYELVNHTADVGIRIRADTLSGLFGKAAYAMFDLIADLEGVIVKEEVVLKLDALDLKELLIKWLRELLYIYAIEGIIFKEFDVEAIGEQHLEAKARGERFDENRHTLNMEIKLVTYHQLEVKQGPQGWTAQVIFDI